MEIKEILGSKSLMKIIVFFIRHPTKKYSQIQLLKQIDITKATIIKQLNLLIKLDLLNLKKLDLQISIN